VVAAHGAWADGSSWKEVILPLSKQGLQVVAAPLPLTSLSDDIVALKRTIVRTKGPVIVAGHAYAGAVIGAANDERVKALVYVYHSRPNDSASEIRSTPRSSLRGRKDYRGKANFRRTNRAFDSIARGAP
jgi:hypothetical protein